MPTTRTSLIHLFGEFAIEHVVREGFEPSGVVDPFSFESEFVLDLRGVSIRREEDCRPTGRLVGSLVREGELVDSV